MAEYYYGITEVFDRSAVEPRFSDLRYHDIPGITINIRLPSKVIVTKLYGAEPRYNDLRSV